jgi:hydroxymethylpyrimidine/phosphomethylpyrimidine kinase
MAASHLTVITRGARSVQAATHPVSMWIARSAHGLAFFMVPVALTIAGSDSSGGAGVQADLKTFAAFGVYGASVLTALTAQNTRGVTAIAEVSPDFVVAQYEAVMSDLTIAAAKTGMLARTAIIEALARCLGEHPVPWLVVDPVMVATSGDVLLEADAITAMRDLILPLASVVTPNLHEAEILINEPVGDVDAMRRAARRLVELGARAALVKGGHLEHDAVDILYDGRVESEFRSPRVRGIRTHGAGCTLSAAIAASLAHGSTLAKAVSAAKRFVTRAIESAPALGGGGRPLNHLVRGARARRRAR